MHGRAQSLPAVLRLLTGFVVLSVLAGLLLAGLGLPAVGMVGSATRSSVDAFNALPSNFDISPLAQQSQILDAAGNRIANPYDENRIIVSLDQISPLMQQAQIAIEDDRFYQHGGLDLRGFARAMFSNLSGGQVQGASTLTQQYVKITLQENALRRDDLAAAQAATAQTYMRKLQELKYAINVEENYTKDQILAGYLNLVYYGDQAYGVEAASQNYFGISAKDLNLGQAALLAGIVQQPSAYNPVTNPADAQARRDVVLSRMEELGVASAEDVAAAKAIEVSSMIHKTENKGVCHRSSQPYFCAYVLAYLRNSPQMAVLGATPDERMKRVNQGGLTIRTTLNPAMQDIAMARLTEATPLNDDQGIGSATTILEPGTGKVLAMAQTSTFDQTEVVWNADQVYGGPAYGWQFGSTAKPFALITAVERGMPINASIYAPSAGPGRPYSFSPDLMYDQCGTSQPWPVINDYYVGGNMSIQSATSNSINTAYALLTTSLGPCDVRDTMTKMGLHQSNGEPIDPNVASITLGAGTTTPMSLGTAFATLAARGLKCEPNPIVSITTADQQEVPVPASTCTQVIAPEVADAVTQVLQGPLRNGTAAGAWNWSRPAAGKTGTTEFNNQSWFVGFTPQLAAAVWVGNIQPSDGADLKTLNGKCFGDYGCRGQVFGGTIAAPVWGRMIAQIMDGMEVRDFNPPPNQITVSGDPTGVPRVSGMDQTAAIRTLRDAGFFAYISRQVDGGGPAGSVVSTQPAGGQAPKGSVIALTISSGKAPAPKPEASPSPSASPSPTP